MTRQPKEMPANSPLEGRPILPVIRALVPSLRAADARVAKVILEQPHLVIARSAAEVADMAGTSGATVVRCAQQLGFKGFSDLRFALAAELSMTQELSDLVADGQPDPDAALIQRITGAGAVSVREVAGLIDIDAFRASADALARARKILFLGVGASHALSQHAAFSFTLWGMDAEAPADPHIQHMKAELLTGEDVCVALSMTGQTRETFNTVRAAAGGGATTIAITSFARSPLTEVVDHTLVAGSARSVSRLQIVASRLAMLAVLDCLLGAIESRIEPTVVAEVGTRLNGALMDHYL